MRPPASAKFSRLVAPVGVAWLLGFPWHGNITTSYAFSGVVEVPPITAVSVGVDALILAPGEELPWYRWM